MASEEQRQSDTEAMINEQIDEMTDDELLACEERVKKLGKEVQKLIDWRWMIKDSVDNFSEEIQRLIQSDRLNNEDMIFPQSAEINEKDHPVRQEMNLKSQKLRVMSQISLAQSIIYSAVINRHDNNCPHCYDNFFQESEREYYELLQAMQIMLNKFGGGIAVVQYVPREYQRNWQIVEGKDE